jgi:hypothetical protein
MAVRKIIPVATPNLIVAPEEYSKSREEQLNNELRLYFNRLNGNINTIADTGGGVSISFPHITAYSDVDQYAGGDDTPTIVAFNNSLNNVGFTFNPDGTANALYDGNYQVEYRLQAVNTSNGALDTVVWLQVNGEDIPDSATKYTIPARKSAGVPSFSILASFVSWNTVQNDRFALYWATEQAYESGVQDGVYLEATAAQTSPYAHPEIPSSYGVIQYIGRE